MTYTARPARRLLATLLLLLAFAPTLYAQDTVTFDAKQSVGGALTTVAATATHVFVTQAGGVSVFEASTLNRVARLDGAASGTVVGNQLLGVRGATLTIADITNPAAPVLLGSVQLDANTGLDATAPVVVGNHAYVGLSSFSTGSLKVVDISTPGSPVVVATVNRRAQGVGVANGHVVVLDRQTAEVVAFDVSTPANPTQVGVVDLGTRSDDLAAVGNLIFVGIGSRANAGLAVIDASDPANLAILAQGVSGSSDAYGRLIANGSTVYANNFDEPRTLDVFDVSNPAAPAFRGSIGSDFDVNLAVVGTTVYETNNKTLRAIDASDPAAPTEADRVTTELEFASRMVALDGHLYVNAEQPVRLAIGDEGALTFEATLPFADFPTTIGGTDGHLYVGSFNGVTLFDVTDPDAPVERGTASTAGAPFGLAATGTLVVATLDIFGSSDLAILDFAVPDTPVQRGTYTPGAHALALAFDAVGTTLYVVTEQALEIVDLSDPTAPTLVGSVNLAGSGQAIALAGTTAFVGSLTLVNNFAPPTGWFVEAIDVSNPAAPSVLATTSATNETLLDLVHVGDGTVVGSFPEFGLRAFALEEAAGKRSLMETVVTQGTLASNGLFGSLVGIPDAEENCPNLFTSTGNGFFSYGSAFNTPDGGNLLSLIIKLPPRAPTGSELRLSMVTGERIICPPNKGVFTEVATGSFQAIGGGWEVASVRFEMDGRLADTGLGLRLRDLAFPLQLETSKGTFLALESNVGTRQGLSPDGDLLAFVTEIQFELGFAMAEDETVTFALRLQFDYDAPGTSEAPCTTHQPGQTKIRFVMNPPQDVSATPDVSPGQVTPTQDITSRLSDFACVIDISDQPRRGAASIQLGVSGADVDHQVGVCPGTYFENVSVIHEDLRLFSFEGPDTTTVRAADPNADVFTIQDDKIELSGFFIRDGNNGVLIPADVKEAIVGLALNDSAPAATGAAKRTEELCLSCNAIAGNAQHGVHLLGNNNGVFGNYIGLSPDGRSLTGLQNQSDGVAVDGDENQIGDPGAEANLISGNRGHGIEVNGNKTRIIGNLIGPEANGEVIGNDADGISVTETAKQTRIGGLNAVGGERTQGNVISGNGRGISVSGADSTSILGNRIGPCGGSECIGNAVGVQISNSDPSTQTLVGAAYQPDGTFVVEGNVISGNEGAGIVIGTPSAVAIVNNIIGLDETGTQALGNRQQGIRVGGTLGVEKSRTIIGALPLADGSLQLHGNIIGANGRDGFDLFSGIEIRDDSVQVVANLIGLGGDGSSQGNVKHGVEVASGTGVLIGAARRSDGQLVLAPNTITSNGPGTGNVDAAEVQVSERAEVVAIVGNILGLDEVGAQVVENGANDAHGIRIEAASGGGSNQVWVGAAPHDDGSGTFLVAGNTISGHFDGEVLIQRDSVAVVANRIGLDPTGEAARGGTGIVVDSVAAHVLIGALRRPDGTLLVRGNTISGNTRFNANGITVEGDSVGVIANRVGVNAAGAQAVANGGDGIQIDRRAQGVLIGAARQADGGLIVRGNVISGNGARGVDVIADSVLVVGNFIGVTTGGAAVGNTQEGLRLLGNHNRVGGTPEAFQNTISSNGDVGIRILGDGNVLGGNVVGLDPAGAEDRGNAQQGILLEDIATETLIGAFPGESEGDFVFAENVVSGNGSHGIDIAGPRNQVYANIVGLDDFAQLARGNDGDGIHIRSTASNTRIGDGDEDGRNIVGSNAGHGIFVAADSTSILDNHVGAGFLTTLLVPNGQDGIRIDGSGRDGFLTDTRVEQNLVHGHDDPDSILGNGTRAGVRLLGVFDAIVRQNTIVRNDFGVHASIFNGVFIVGNDLDANETGIRIPNPNDAFISGNTIRNSTAPRTGIHLSDGAGGTVRGNVIENNNGAGLFVQGNGQVKAEANTFSGNASFGIENTGTSVVDATGNFWGAADGPSGNGAGSGDAVSGNVNAGSFRTEAINVVVSAPDRIAAEVEASSSVELTFQNFANRTDVLTVTVTDELGWVGEPTGAAGKRATSVSLTNPLGGSLVLPIDVPAGTANATANKVTITAISQSDASQQDTFELTILAGPESVLPVELTDFEVLLGDDAPGNDNGPTGTNAPATQADLAGRFDAGSVVLRWATATETNNAGFEVEYRTRTGDDGTSATAWGTHGFVDGAGTTLQAQRYTYRIRDLEPGTYQFRLRQVDFDGTFAYSPEIEVTLEAPHALKLAPNYPNPFNPTTTIRFTVPTSGRAEVVVYNALGQEVATVFDGMAEAGHIYMAPFDASGLASGVYVYRLRFDGQVRTRQMLLLK